MYATPISGILLPAGDGSMRPWTPRDLRRLVGRTVTGRGRSLSTEVTAFLWGDADAPQLWRDWPPEARQLWDEAVRLYMDVRKRQGTDVGLDEMWAAVEGCSESDWWRVGGTTWADLAAWLSITPRQAAYRMHRVGWRMRGVGMGVSDRVVVAAPCVDCGLAWPRRMLDDRRGPCCRAAGGVG